MESFFVDTTFWVSRFNRRDERHDDAARTFADLARGEHGRFRLVTTDYVFDETVTAILARSKRHSWAAEAGDSVLESRAVRLVRVSAPEFDSAWELFKDRADKAWSFTDCTSFVVMDRQGLRKALSFDENFRQAGFATFPE